MTKPTPFYLRDTHWQDLQEARLIGMSQGIERYVTNASPFKVPASIRGDPRSPLFNAIDRIYMAYDQIPAAIDWGSRRLVWALRPNVIVCPMRFPREGYMTYRIELLEET